MYPYAPQMPVIYYPTIVMVPLVVWMLYQSYTKKLKVIFFGVSFFTVNIFFLLQILSAGQGFLADRFTYIPYLGLFFMVGYYTQKVYRKESFKKIGKM